MLSKCAASESGAKSVRDESSSVLASSKSSDSVVAIAMYRRDH